MFCAQSQVAFVYVTHEVRVQPSSEEAAVAVTQVAERHRDRFYRRVACPIFRTMEREAAKAIVHKNLAFGSWKLLPIEPSKHLRHADSTKVASGFLTEDVHVLIRGLAGVQAGAHVENRRVTFLSEILVPGEVCGHFGVVAELGKCGHPIDELAAVFALQDSWFLSIPKRDFAAGEAFSHGDKSYRGAAVRGLMGSLFDTLSTNRVVERRLAGANGRVRFVATMLAIVARHGLVLEGINGSWSVCTSFKATGQFFKGLARLRGVDQNWRQPLHMPGVLEIPDANGREQVRLWPEALVPRSVWNKVVEGNNGKQLPYGVTVDWPRRKLCRDAAYAAYRAADRPCEDELAPFGFTEDCLKEWAEHLASVLPKAKKAEADSSYLADLL